MKPKVFINYAKDWQPKALEINNLLLKGGCDPWIDKHKLTPGVDWKESIRKAIGDADIFLACLSPNYYSTKGYRHVELKLAYDELEHFPEGKVFVIPIKLHPDAELPSRFQNYQELNYYEWGADIRLLEAIEIHTSTKLDKPIRFFPWTERPVELDEFSTKLKRECEAHLAKATNYISELVHSTDNPDYMIDIIKLSQDFRGEILSTVLDIEITCLDAHTNYIGHSNVNSHLFLGMSFDSQWRGSQGSFFSDWVIDKINSYENGILSWEDDMSSNLAKEKLSLMSELSGYKRKTIAYFSNVPLREERKWTVIIEGHETEYR